MNESLHVQNAERKLGNLTLKTLETFEILFKTFEIIFELSSTFTKKVSKLEQQGFQNLGQHFLFLLL